MIALQDVFAKNTVLDSTPPYLRMSVQRLTRSYDDDKSARHLYLSPAFLVMRALSLHETGLSIL